MTPTRVAFLRSSNTFAIRRRVEGNRGRHRADDEDAARQWRRQSPGAADQRRDSAPARNKAIRRRAFDPCQKPIGRRKFDDALFCCIYIRAGRCADSSQAGAERTAKVNAAGKGSGSRIPTKVCRLDKEWELLARDAQDDLRDSRSSRRRRTEFGDRARSSQSPSLPAMRDDGMALFAAARGEA